MLVGSFFCLFIKLCKMSKKKSNNEFIREVQLIHHNRYDYSKVKYINNKTKVCIICPDHGEFWQIPSDHLNGKGCPQCAGNVRYNKDTFVEKAKIIHNDRYDYSKVQYVNAHTKVCVICPEHGEFWQTPNNHLNGNGCPLCKNRKIGDVLRDTVEDFIEKSNELNEITNCLKVLLPQQRNREILRNREIDIYIPLLKLGIEYNGLHWHSERLGKGKNYHLDKLNKCNEQGIRLIQIFEDEWINRREICESKLKQICGLNTNPKIYARKCEIREITNKNEAYEFLDKNHIQGRTGFTIALGTYYNNELVGVMTFKKEKEGYWDLNRFATDINHQCIGIGGKLFKYFIRNYPFIEIKSFADRRWTTDPTNNLYTKLGFAFDSFVPPTYWYYNPKISRIERFHKFGFRKQHLHKQYGLPLTMTEREMTETLGYTRIWDCGLIKYVYRV